MIKTSHSTLKRIKIIMANKSLRTQFIQDVLSLKIKRLETLLSCGNKWDYDLRRNHYFAISKYLITLEDSRQIIVRIAYFRQDNLLAEWEEYIIKEGSLLLLKSQELSEQELKDNPLIPTHSIAITHDPKENLSKVLRIIKDEYGNYIQSNRFPEKIAAKILYLDLSKASHP